MPSNGQINSLLLTVFCCNKDSLPSFVFETWMGTISTAERSTDLVVEHGLCIRNLVSCTKIQCFLKKSCKIMTHFIHSKHRVALAQITHPFY